MKNLSSYLFEGFFSNIGNDRDVALKKAIQNFDALIKDCVELLKSMVVDIEDKDRLIHFDYFSFNHIRKRFKTSKQYTKLIDTFKFLIENHEYGIIVSTESGGKRDIKPGEYKAFREYGANRYDQISEMPTLVTYKNPDQAAEGFFSLLFVYAFDLNTKDWGLSSGNFKIQDIYLVKDA